MTWVSDSESEVPQKTTISFLFSIVLFNCRILLYKAPDCSQMLKVYWREHYSNLWKC